MVEKISSVSYSHQKKEKMSYKLMTGNVLILSLNGM